MITQTDVRAWEREFDEWVIRTDCATILLETAAADLIKSEDEGNSLSEIEHGSYLGECMAMAILSGVPLSVIDGKVRSFAGVDGP